MNASDPKGWVHSLESLGASDGPGLRTVIFLSGCPLRCKFCHNPDTWTASSGKETPVSELLRRALRNKPYFGARGGVTISGGEPLAQPYFTLALIKAFKQEGIHVTIDTSGWFEDAAADAVRQILSDADLILLDIKSPDPAGFKALTGRSMAPLLQSLDLLEKSETPVWIRQVIVPGLNDQLENIRETVNLLRQYPMLNIEKVQLLPYHALGQSKWEQLQIPYPLKDTPPMSPSQMKTLQALAEKLLAG